MKPPTANARQSNARRARRLAAIVILSAIALWLWAARQRQRHSASAASSTTNSARASMTDDRMGAVDSVPLVVKWPIGIARDPFIWVNAPSANVIEDIPSHDVIEREAADALKVKAIVYLDESSLVYVNGQVHRQGDTVAGFRIQSIEQRHILVEKNGVVVQIGVRARESERSSNVN